MSLWPEHPSHLAPSAEQTAAAMQALAAMRKLLLKRVRAPSKVSCGEVSNAGRLVDRVLGS